MTNPVYVTCEQQRHRSPAHPHSLFSAFIVRGLGSIITQIAVYTKSSRGAACEVEQTSLSVNCLQISEDRFTRGIFAIGFHLDTYSLALKNETSFNGRTIFLLFFFSLLKAQCNNFFKKKPFPCIFELVALPRTDTRPHIHLQVCFDRGVILPQL